MFHIFYNSFSIYAIFYVPPQKSLPTSLPVWGTPKLSCVRICLFVCGCLRVFELQSDKERNERSPKNVSVKPAVNFWLLAWPSSSLFTWPPPVGPTFCTTHPSPPPSLAHCCWLFCHRSHFVPFVWSWIAFKATHSSTPGKEQSHGYTAKNYHDLNNKSSLCFLKLVCEELILSIFILLNQNRNWN